MKYKLYAFFSGRNGMDDLAKIILWPSFILLLASSFVPLQWLHTALYLVATVGLVYAYFRVLSKNLAKRQAENQKFVSWKNFHKMRFQQQKTHRFYRCPNCKTHLRVPKGKGKISITCKNCGEKLIKNT